MPAYDAEALREVIRDFRDCRKGARDAMPGKHAATVDEGIAVGKLLGQRDAFTYAIIALQNLLFREEGVNARNPR